MNKSYIIKYIVGWIIISYIINYFFGSKKLSVLKGSAIVRVMNNTLISQKPMQCDLKLFQEPIVKEKEMGRLEAKNDGKKIIVVNPKGSRYSYSFSESFGAPIKVVYHLSQNEDIIIFDKSEERSFPSLTLAIDGVIISDFTCQLQEDDKIVFISTFKGMEVKKEFLYKDNFFSCAIFLGDGKEKDDHQIQIIGTASNSQFCNNKDDGAFIYISEDGVVKFLPANKDSIDQTIILNPNMIGVQSEYTVDSIVAKTNIDRGYFSLDQNNQVTYYSNFILDKNDPRDIISFDWYGGVKDVSMLNKVNWQLGKIMEYGFFLSIASFFLAFILWITSLVKSFGLALIIFIALTKLIFFPFIGIFKQYSKKNKELQQKLEYIKVKHHDNPELRRHEEMLAYQKFGFMPFFMSMIPQLCNIFIIMSIQGIMKKNVALYKMPIGLWLSDAMMPDPYYILPILFFVALFITVNNMKQASPMVKIAILLASVILVYFYSYWSSAMQLFILIGLVINYYENTFLYNRV